MPTRYHFAFSNNLYISYEAVVWYMWCCRNLDLLDSPLAMISLTGRYNPLVWFPDLSSLVSSFGLMMC